MSRDDALPTDLDAAHRLIRRQQAMIERMQQQLDRLLRRAFGPSSEKVGPDQLLLFGGEPSTPPPPPAPAEPRTRAGHGRQTLPANLPRVEVLHDLPEAEKLCPECGVERARIGAETSEQLEYVPASLRVLVHTRPKYACRACQGHVTIAPRPAEPIDRGLPGVGVPAQVIVSKDVDHLPLYRQEAIFARQGITLARSTLCDWTAASAGLLEPIVTAMHRRILQSRAIQTDDTPVTVQDPGGGGSSTGRLWVDLGDREHPFMCYDFTADRRRDGPERFLQSYSSGYLQSDAYAGYDGLHARGLIEVGCRAHARRKFHEARRSDPARAEAAIAFIGRLYGVERLARDACEHRLPELGPEPTAAERWALHDPIVASWRARESVPILEGFSAWLEAQLGSVLPRSPLGEAIAYARSNGKALTRYLEHPWLAPDNNASERAIRPIAVGRKNWLHLGSAAGGRTAAILLSVTQSARAFGLEPWSYLRDLLGRVGTHPARRIAELLPDQWQPGCERS
jgi:transposase